MEELRKLVLQEMKLVMANDFDNLTNWLGVDEKKSSSENQETYCIAWIFWDGLEVELLIVNLNLRKIIVKLSTVYYCLCSRVIRRQLIQQQLLEIKVDGNSSYETYRLINYVHFTLSIFWEPSWFRNYTYSGFLCRPWGLGKSHWKHCFSEIKI